MWWSSICVQIVWLFSHQQNSGEQGTKLDPETDACPVIQQGSFHHQKSMNPSGVSSPKFLPKTENRIRKNCSKNMLEKTPYDFPDGEGLLRSLGIYIGIPRKLGPFLVKGALRFLGGFIHIFSFHPYWGRFEPLLTCAYFSDGLKPPTIRPDIGWQGW